jgi:hypothetical protein
MEEEEEEYDPSRPLSESPERRERGRGGGREGGIMERWTGEGRGGMSGRRSVRGGEWLEEEKAEVENEEDKKGERGEEEGWRGKRRKKMTKTMMHRRAKERQGKEMFTKDRSKPTGKKKRTRKTGSAFYLVFFFLF